MLRHICGAACWEREADSAYSNLQWTILAPSDDWLPKSRDRPLHFCPAQKLFQQHKEDHQLAWEHGRHANKVFHQHFKYRQQPAQQVDKYATSFQYFCLPSMNFSPSLSISIHISNFLSTTLSFCLNLSICVHITDTILQNSYHSEMTVGYLFASI